MQSDYFPATLVEALARSCQGAHSIRFITRVSEQSELAYRDLPTRALKRLYHLQQQGLQPGSELIIYTEHPLHFVEIFWACVLGGIVAVPVAVGVADANFQRLMNIITTLKQPFLYMDNRYFQRFQAYLGAQKVPQRSSEWLSEHSCLSDQLPELEQTGEPASVVAEQTALIQFSSGSTGTPKGVVLTHRNLLTNIRSIIHNTGGTDQASTLSWMPLTHDMGLIGFHLGPLVGNIPQTLMATELFARHPLFWLQKITELQPTITASPNFGFRHVLKAIRAKSSPDLDLSSLRLIFNGAEPISPSLCRTFNEAMAQYGLSDRAMFPVYGLAEASLAAAFPEPEQPLGVVCIQRDGLQLGQAVTVLPPNSAEGLSLVQVGRPVRETGIQLVDADGTPVGDQRLGRILIRGENVTAKYYASVESEAEPSAFLTDGWLDTGDLGFWYQGQLVVSGRTKELIILNGQNYHPHDLESMCESLDGLDAGKVAVCGVRNDAEDTDELVVFVLFRGNAAKCVSMAKTITALLSEAAGVSVDQVVPVKQIPKTTSGKIQRVQLAEQYRQGVFTDAVEPLRAAMAADSSAEAVAPGAQSGDSGPDRAEAILAICNAVITDQSVGPEDNLFEMGISSLKLAQIHEQLDQRFPDQLDVTDLFDYPTVNELSQFLERKQT